MKEIILSQNKVTLVDDCDYERVIIFNWYAMFMNGRYYAYVNHNRKPMSLARYIMSPHENLVVDHISGDTLDNRRSNLRIATHSVNNQNRRAVSKCGFKGVDFIKNGYRARIKKDKIEYHIGVYETGKEAAIAYDLKALEFYGPNAGTNKKMGLL